MNRLVKGDVAPKFTLLNQSAKPLALADFLGKKVLIYFYPRAMTPGCITQACGLRDTQKEFQSQQVITLGISPDSPEKLAKFVEKKQLNFSLLSDETHSVAEQFGVWGEKKFMGKSYIGMHRISFLIDEAGIIEHVFDKFKTKEHHQVVLDFLAQN